MIQIKAYLTNTNCEPSRATVDSAGVDLRANVTRPVRLMPGESAKIPTGLRLEIPEGFAGFIVPRSGLAAKYQISVVNSPGLIDSDYRGEVSVLLENRGRLSFVLEPEERIAQLIFIPLALAQLTYVDGPNDLSATSRGDSGFGSTGQI